MTDESVQRVLGKLEAGIENLADNQRKDREERRADIQKIFARLDIITSEGCAQGKRNADAIRALQAAPGKMIAAVAAVVSAVGAAMAWWK